MRFLPDDGDAWHERNTDRLASHDPVVETLVLEGMHPERVLEIGCGSGNRLNRIRERYGSECTGCDISPDALMAGQLRYGREINLAWREAHNLKLVASSYDLVIYGFCLYVCPPDRLLQIAAEGDRVLKDGGYLVVHDFMPDYPHARIYKYNPMLRSRKMDYSKLWLSHPAYSLVRHKVYPHKEGEEIDNNTRTVVTILKKDTTQAFPLHE